MISILILVFDIWLFILWFVILFFVMMFGNVIRRKVKFFRNFLFFIVIIVGFLGLGVKYL